MAGEASSIPPVNPGTAAPVRSAPPHRGATGLGGPASPSSARTKALDNLAKRGRIGKARGGPPKGVGTGAHLGKNLPAADSDGEPAGAPNDNDADDR